MKRTRLTTFLALAAAMGAIAPPALAAGEIQAYLGNPSQGGRIKRFTEGTGQTLPSQPELRGLRLLPLDFNARLARDEFSPQRAHYRGDIEGAGRIELPNGHGVLYRFKRVLPGAQGRFGFLRITQNGNTQLIGERVGTGVGATGDPYGGRIALAPNGTKFLVSTTHAAGGNVLEIDVLSGLIVDRSATLSPLDLRPRSLRMTDTWAVAVARQGIFHSGLGASDQLTAVVLDAGTTFHSGEVVLSADSSKALTTAGTAPDALHAWVFDSTGVTTRASRDPVAMSGAGYLPEAPHGPFLAVADDGVLCAWRTEGLVSREVFARRATAAPTLAATHVSSDSNFTDTLDEAGVLSMFQPGKLLFVLGEQGPGLDVGIEKVDLFEVVLDAGGTPTISNVTGTSGEFATPYLSPPQITPLFVRWLPAAQAYLLYDEQSGGTGRLATIDPLTTGIQTIIPAVKEVFFVELIGDVVIISLRMSEGAKPHRIVRLPADLSAAPTIEFDAGDNELTHALVDETGWIAFTEVPQAGQQLLHRYRVAGGQLDTFPLPAVSFGPVLSWTQGGDLAFSLDRGGLRFFAAWPRPNGAPYRLKAVSTTGAILPGR